MCISTYLADAVENGEAEPWQGFVNRLYHYRHAVMMMRWWRFDTTAPCADATTVDRGVDQGSVDCTQFDIYIILMIIEAHMKVWEGSKTLMFLII